VRVKAHSYNILMTARLREEMLAGKPVRTAVAEAVGRVAPAVAAAGLVLASSFGTLMLESTEVAKQQGFAMAFGILLASLVVSSILVPRSPPWRGGEPGGPADPGPHRIPPPSSRDPTPEGRRLRGAPHATKKRSMTGRASGAPVTSSQSSPSSRARPNERNAQQLASAAISSRTRRSTSGA
jgi:MMPL family